MKTKALTATQIDTLAQRLSETPVAPSATAKKAGDNLARLLAAGIGAERAALAFTSILTAETFDQAEARLTLVLDYGNHDPAGEPIMVPVDQAPCAPRGRSAGPCAGSPSAAGYRRTGSVPGQGRCGSASQSASRYPPAAQHPQRRLSQSFSFLFSVTGAPRSGR